MTTELNEQQLARLAKLGNRKSAAARPVPPPPTPAATWGPPAGPVAQGVAATPPVDRHTSVRLFGNRRRHAAAAGRILATGLATSGFLATIASFATVDAHSLESQQADPAATPTSLVETIHRVTYVDEFGNPIAPPTTVAAPADPIATTLGDPTAVIDPNAVADPLAPTTVPGAAPAAAPAAPAVAAPSNGAATPAPVAAQVPAAAPAPVAAPAPAVAPDPTAAPAPTPAPAPAPAPDPTPAPAPAPPPAPTPTPAPAPAPAPPVCQGSGC